MMIVYVVAVKMRLKDRNPRNQIIRQNKLGLNIRGKVHLKRKGCLAIS